MTVAPPYPLQHAYLGDESPFDLVPSAWGTIERWRANALRTGETGGLAELSRLIANDSAATIDALETRAQQVAAREVECDARERRIGDMAARVADLAGRASLEWDRVQKARAAAAAGEPLPSPPGATPEPSLPTDDTPAPSRELHSVAAKEVPEIGHGDETEFPNPELPRPPMTHPQPIAAGLDGKEN